MDEKLTPLYKEHQRLGARLGPFGGWLMPIQYEGIIAEHQWTRSSASIFDICHMGEFIIHGGFKKTGLDRIVTLRLHDMQKGACRYGLMLNENGGIVDDLVVYKIDEEKWMLVVNAATTPKDESHIRKNILPDARFEDISEKTAKIDLQGPLSTDVLAAVLGISVDPLKYYRFGSFSISGEECIISRTGYTGELGYEVYLNSENAVSLWQALLKDSRVKPAGLGARDTLRLEMGYPLYGQDIDDAHTPHEAGLERFVDLDKDFIGREAFLDKKVKGPHSRLVCFTTNSRRQPRHNYKICLDNKEVGIVTSGTFSPSLSRGIGMGYVENGYEALGSEIAIVGDRAQEMEARICERPFYRKGSLREVREG